MTMLVTARRGRTSSHQFTITDAAGSNVSIAAADVLRVKVGHDLETPLLDFDSAQPSSNGSTVSRANPCTLRLDQTDLNTLQPGTYSIEVAVVDNSDQGDIKHAERGVLTLESSQLGDVGLT